MPQIISPTSTLPAPSTGPDVLKGAPLSPTEFAQVLVNLRASIASMAASGLPARADLWALFGVSVSATTPTLGSYADWIAGTVDFWGWVDTSASATQSAAITSSGGLVEGGSSAANGTTASHSAAITSTGGIVEGGSATVTASAATQVVSVTSAGGEIAGGAANVTVQNTASNQSANVQPVGGETEGGASTTITGTATAQSSNITSTGGETEGGASTVTSANLTARTFQINVTNGNTYINGVLAAIGGYTISATSFNATVIGAGGSCDTTSALSGPGGYSGGYSVVKNTNATCYVASAGGSGEKNSSQHTSTNPGTFLAASLTGMSAYLNPALNGGAPVTANNPIPSSGYGVYGLGELRDGPTWDFGDEGGFITASGITTADTYTCITGAAGQKISVDNPSGFVGAGAIYLQFYNATSGLPSPPSSASVQSSGGETEGGASIVAGYNASKSASVQSSGGETEGGASTITASGVVTSGSMIYAAAGTYTHTFAANTTVTLTYLYGAGGYGGNTDTSTTGANAGASYIKYPGATVIATANGGNGGNGFMQSAGADGTASSSIAGAISATGGGAAGGGSMGSDGGADGGAGGSVTGGTFAATAGQTITIVLAPGDTDASVSLSWI